MSHPVEENPDPVVATVQRVLERAPQWVRHDMAVKDAIVRQRAEETLAAMIASALSEKGCLHPGA